MRFIHTADWHLGNRLHEIDRETEFKSFLEWLKLTVEEKKADALIVSGDIFDVANPSSEAQTLLYSFLASLKTSCCKNIIITGGNHDSAARLEIAKELAEQNNIHIVGSINNLEIKDLVFELKDSHNEVCGICIAVPFVREIEMHPFVETSVEENQTDKNFSDLGYEKIYKLAFEEAEKIRKNRKIPVIAMGHLYAANLEGRLAQADSKLKTDDGVKVIDPVGNLGNVHSEVFPPELDYVALGHIHYTTMVSKNPKIRYSGSPFVLGFDEANLPRYVLCVDCNFNEENTLFTEPEVEKVKVPSFVNYKRISGTYEEIKASLEKMCTETFDKPVYLELNYKKQHGIDIRERLQEVISQLPEKVTVVNWKPMDFINSQGKVSFNDVTNDEMKNLDEKEVFTQLILEKLELDSESVEAKEALDVYLPLFMEISAQVDEKLKSEQE